MNKAFVKEAESKSGRCPKCDSFGIAVTMETLAAFVRSSKLADIGGTAYFCDFARCEVAYFDDFERYLTVEDLLRPVWPKDVEAPMCGCFGFTAEEVAADIRDGGVARIKAAVARANSPEARCQTMSAAGKSCAAEIQRYYFRLKSHA